MLKFDSLPQLAVGSHLADSGRACIMNALSYLNGDVRITDTPDCVWLPLAHLAQAVNDNCCSPEHPGSSVRSHSADPSDPTYDMVRHGLLCPSCTHKMWLIGARLIGSGEASKLPASVALAAAKAMVGVAVEDFADRGGCPMMVEVFHDALLDRACVDDVLSLRQRCIAEHDCIRSALGGQMTRLTFGICDVKRVISSEVEVMELVGITRIVLMECDDEFALFHKMIDVFERQTGLRPIEPTRNEIDRAAQRAGLALV